MIDEDTQKVFSALSIVNFDNSFRFSKTLPVIMRSYKLVSIAKAHTTLPYICYTIIHSFVHLFIHSFIPSCFRSPYAVSISMRQNATILVKLCLHQMRFK